MHRRRLLQGAVSGTIAALLAGCSRDDGGGDGDDGDSGGGGGLYGQTDPGTGAPAGGNDPARPAPGSTKG